MPKTIRRQSREGCEVDENGRITDIDFHAELLADDSSPLGITLEARSLARSLGWAQEAIDARWPLPPDAT